MKEEFKIFVEKVPALRSKWKIFLTLLYMFSLIFLTIFYFYTLDSIFWFMPILTQSLMSGIAILIAYLHFKKVHNYQKKYGELAYQPFFYHFIIPYLIVWYALFFHPLFISGIPLFPFWISLMLGIIFFIFMVLVSVHIERAGFKMVTHGMDIYTVFPEETTIVRGEIYGYIRHPLYLSLTCGCFALAFIANNIIAIFAATIQVIPSILVAKMEDKELIERDGDAHRDYINSTAILFPFKRIFSFLKLLIFFK